MRFANKQLALVAKEECENHSVLLTLPPERIIIIILSVSHLG